MSFLRYCPIVCALAFSLPSLADTRTTCTFLPTLATAENFNAGNKSLVLFRETEGAEPVGGYIFDSTGMILTAREMPNVVSGTDMVSPQLSYARAWTEEPGYTHYHFFFKTTGSNLLKNLFYKEISWHSVTLKVSQQDPAKSFATIGLKDEFGGLSSLVNPEYQQVWNFAETVPAECEISE